MKTGSTNPSAIPTDPDLYSGSLLNAARAYKFELNMMRQQGLDIGNGHKIHRMHLTTIPTPWFLGTKTPSKATWLEHIDHTAARVKEVMLHDEELGVPFDQPTFGQRKESKVLDGVFPRDADRISTVVGMELLRMGLGLQVRSMSRGKVTDVDSILREVRKSIFHASQDFTIGSTKRPLPVGMPMHPLWSKSKVQAISEEDDGPSVSVLEATKSEQKLVRHLIGPSMQPNASVPNILDTRIARICMKAMPNLFERHPGQFIEYHSHERKALKNLLSGTDVFTPSLRRQSVSSILEMLATRAQCSADWIEKIETEVCMEQREKGEISMEDSPVSIMAGSIPDILRTYIDPLIAEYEPGNKVVLAKMLDRLYILVARLAMVIDDALNERIAQEDSEEVTNQISDLIDRLRVMTIALGGAGYEETSTMALMLIEAYLQDDTVTLRSYL